MQYGCISACCDNLLGLWPHTYGQITAMSHGYLCDIAHISLIKGAFTLGTFSAFRAWLWLCVRHMKACKWTVLRKQLIRSHSFAALIALTIGDYTACSHLLVYKVNHHHCHPLHVVCWTNDVKLKCMHMLILLPDQVCTLVWDAFMQPCHSSTATNSDHLHQKSWTGTPVHPLVCMTAFTLPFLFYFFRPSDSRVFNQVIPEILVSPQNSQCNWVCIKLFFFNGFDDDTLAIS